MDQPADKSIRCRSSSRARTRLRGRIRDLTCENGPGVLVRQRPDQKGAALNAVQILETLI